LSTLMNNSIKSKSTILLASLFCIVTLNATQSTSQFQTNHKLGWFRSMIEDCSEPEPILDAIEIVNAEELTYIPPYITFTDNGPFENFEEQFECLMQHSGMTPLQIVLYDSLQYRFLEQIALRLIDKLTPTQLTQKDFNGLTALFYADRCNPEITYQLLKKYPLEASLSQQNEKGSTLLTVYCIAMSIHKNYGLKKSILYLIANLTPEQLVIKDDHQLTALFYIMFTQEPELIEKFMEKYPEDDSWNQKNNANLTPIMNLLCAFTNNPQLQPIVLRFIQHLTKQELKIKNNAGFDVLYFAQQSTDPLVIKSIKKKLK